MNNIPFNLTNINNNKLNHEYYNNKYRTCKLYFCLAT